MNTPNPYFRATRMPYASVPLGAADISSGASGLLVLGLVGAGILFIWKGRK